MSFMCFVLTLLNLHSLAALSFYELHIQGRSYNISVKPSSNLLEAFIELYFTRQMMDFPLHLTMPLLFPVYICMFFEILQRFHHL